LRSLYREKLAAVLAALDEQCRRCGIAAHWTRPAGGLYVWFVLPPAFDTTRGGRLFQRCMEQGVLYVPGEYCFPMSWLSRESGVLGGPRHTMRLSFGVQPIERLREGVARLAAAIAETGESID
jgi:2-aminoadipate transaminase